MFRVRLTRCGGGGGGGATFDVAGRRSAAMRLLLLLLLLDAGRRRSSVVRRSDGREGRVGRRHGRAAHQPRRADPAAAAAGAAAERPVLAAARGPAVLELGLELVLADLGAVARLTLVLHRCNDITSTNTTSTLIPPSRQQLACMLPILLTLPAQYAQQGICSGRVSVCPSVCLFICPVDRQQGRRAAGLLLSAGAVSGYRSTDAGAAYLLSIDICCRRSCSAANAGSVMLTAEGEDQHRLVIQHDPNAGNSRVAKCRSQTVPKHDLGHFQRTSQHADGTDKPAKYEFY